MPRASSAAKDAALNGLDGTGTTNVIPYVSLHTGDPGTTGAHENPHTGGYERQPCPWNPAVSGPKTNAARLMFATDGTTPITHFGTWSSGTYGAGVFALGGELASAVTSMTIVVDPEDIELSEV